MESNTTNEFVTLDPRFVLRGWLNQPYVLLDRKTATAHPVPKDVFGTLQLCNGRFRASDPVFFGARKRQLKQLAREGVLAFSSEPSGLGPTQEYRCYPNHYMRQVQWSMTGRCNYRCRHCFMSAPHGVLPQPTTEECLRIADQMAACGVQAVKLTGGECLIRRDFLQIVDRLLAGEVRIATIMTNGALVTEKLLCALRERGVHCGFDISFDGTDGWHDWLRGIDGAEKEAVRAFELCRDHGFPTGAEVMLHRGSLPALRESVRLLGRLGVGSVSVGAIEEAGEAHGIADLILCYDELFDACCEYLPRFFEDGAPVPHINLGGIFEVTRGKARVAQGHTDHGNACESMAACRSIRSTMYLNPDGYVLPCAPFSHDDAVKASFPNLEGMTLAEALTSSSYYDLVAATVGDVFARNSTCQTCVYKSRCLGGCRAKATNEHGGLDPMGLDRTACQFFLDGYYDRAQKAVADLGHGH